MIDENKPDEVKPEKAKAQGVGVSYPVETVESILEKLSAGETIDDILISHPHITKDQILAALAFAAQSLKGESIYPIAI